MLLEMILATATATGTVSPTRTLLPSRTATRTFTPRVIIVPEVTRTPGHSPYWPPPFATPDRLELDTAHAPGVFVPRVTILPPYPVTIDVPAGAHYAIRKHFGALQGTPEVYGRVGVMITAPALTWTPTRRPTSTMTRTNGFTKTATRTPSGPTQSPTMNPCFPIPCDTPTPGPPQTRTRTPTLTPTPTRTATPLPSRWLVMVTWQRGDGSGGAGTRGGDAGVGSWYWYFDQTNPEIFVAVVNGCGVNGHYWVKMFGGTNVQTTVLVKDLVTGREVTYGNPADTLFRTVIDTGNFPCAGGAQ